jgi:uncharacterized membrane protein YccF (DUF307 family)
MRTVLNILNFVLGGFATTLGWLLATVLSVAWLLPCRLRAPVGKSLNFRLSPGAMKLCMSMS